MSEVVGGVAWFGCAVIWLGLGGYAFQSIAKESDASKDPIVGFLFLCLILAPFIAAAMFFHSRNSEKETNA